MFHQIWCDRKEESLQVLDLQGVALEGARTDSNRRHSEPQAMKPILSDSLCTVQKHDSLKTAFAAILRLSLFRD